MITITLHITSACIGLGIGILIGLILCTTIIFDKRWELGFGEGWKANTKEQEEEGE